METKYTCEYGCTDICKGECLKGKDRPIPASNNFSISFQLSDSQQSKFDEWKSHIFALYHEYGSFTWNITNTGIGMGISVTNSLTGTTLDLTDIENW